MTTLTAGGDAQTRVTINGKAFTLPDAFSEVIAGLCIERDEHGNIPLYGKQEPDMHSSIHGLITQVEQSHNAARFCVELLAAKQDDNRSTNIDDGILRNARALLQTTDKMRAFTYWLADHYGVSYDAPAEPLGDQRDAKAREVMSDLPGALKDMLAAVCRTHILLRGNPTLAAVAKLQTQKEHGTLWPDEQKKPTASLIIDRFEVPTRFTDPANWPGVRADHRQACDKFNGGKDTGREYTDILTQGSALRVLADELAARKDAPSQAVRER